MAVCMVHLGVGYAERCLNRVRAWHHGESVDFFIMLLAFAATGVYAWRLFRDNLRIPTFCYVWATSVVILLSGAIYREITGSRARYYDVRGGTHWLTWGQYDGAMLAAAVGIICIALGHYWASHNQWHIPLPEFIDSRAPDAERLRRWAFFLLLAGLVPLLATGILNPVTLLHSLLHGRSVHGRALYLYSEGTYFSFFSVFVSVVPFGVAAVAILVWGGRPPWILLALVVLFCVTEFLSGTRSATATLLAPFVLLPRYMGNTALFKRLAVIGIIAGFLIFTVQLTFRASGFENFRVGELVTRSNPLGSIDGAELDWTAQAISTYGTRFHFLYGQSYLAVLVNPVPRVIWRGKPGGYSSVNAVNIGYPFGATMTSAWMGEAYANFGWLGIPIIGLVAGTLMGILDVFIRRSGAFAMAVFLPLQFHWAFWVRGDSVACLDPWLFGMILLTVFMLAIGPATVQPPAVGIPSAGEPAV